MIVIRKALVTTFAIATLAFGLTGCGGGRAVLGGDPGLSVTDSTSMPVPSREDFESSSEEYYVGPFDRLTIDVLDVDGLSNREAQVDASGRLSFPLAGSINVSGKTTAEIQSEIVTRLRAAHIREPKVTVNLKEALSRVLTIEGEIKKPGVYPLIGRMTLMGAVARAEGTTEFSRLDDVIVFRAVKGQRFAALYDLDAIRHGAYPDPPVYPNDVVMVGNSEGRRRFKDVLSILPGIILPASVALDRLTR